MGGSGGWIHSESRRQAFFFFWEGARGLVGVMAGVWCVCCGVWGGYGMMGSPTQISHTALL